jgi:hypothetical protein
MSYKEIIQSNIAGLNPTGTLDFNGTLSLNGPNNIVVNSYNSSKNNLNKVHNNEVVCSTIENFDNYKKNNYFNIFILIFFILFIFTLYKIFI